MIGKSLPALLIFASMVALIVAYRLLTQYCPRIVCGEEVPLTATALNQGGSPASLPCPAL